MGLFAARAGSFSCDRLGQDNGSRVTLVSANTHGMFEEVQGDLAVLNAINRKPFIAQVTVWDAKEKAGSPRNCRVHFRVGGLYKFIQVHNVGFFSEIPKGSVRRDAAVPDRVVEKLPPIQKGKAGDVGSPGRHPKARAFVFHDEKNKIGESGGDDAAPSDPRTRGRPPAK